MEYIPEDRLGFLWVFPLALAATDIGYKLYTSYKEKQYIDKLKYSIEQEKKKVQELLPVVIKESEKTKELYKQYIDKLKEKERNYIYLAVGISLLAFILLT